MNAPSSTRLRVMVVDDCPDTLWSLAILLRLWGHDACLASDGPSALELAATYQPHVVLLDIALPGMDGCEVARRCRRMDVVRQSFIVALSGCGQEADRQRSLEAGCDQHLVKPVDPEALNSLLASWHQSPTRPGCEALPE